jgi:type VI secretion system protein ImpI/type VI secretion system protein
MGGLAVLPAQRRARLWEEYARLHRCLEAEFEDDFESAFGKAFARAYEGAAAAAKGRKG